MYYHFRPVTRALECPETLGELHVHLALKMLVTERYHESSKNHVTACIYVTGAWRGGQCKPPQGLCMMTMRF